MAHSVPLEGHRKVAYDFFISFGSGKYEQTSGTPCFGNLVTALYFMLLSYPLWLIALARSMELNGYLVLFNLAFS